MLDTRGPFRPLTTARRRCAAARQTGLSLRPLNLRSREITDCGTKHQFAAPAPTAAFVNRPSRVRYYEERMDCHLAV